VFDVHQKTPKMEAGGNGQPTQSALIPNTYWPTAIACSALLVEEMVIGLNARSLFEVLRGVQFAVQV
jgi:hypothetical protein